jgi:pilus assembly protein CpaE
VAVHAGLALSTDDDLGELIRASGAETSTVDLDRADAPVLQILDLVIVDLRGQETLPEELGAFRRRHPELDVIIVTSALDASLILEALRAGVGECVTWPLKQDELTAAIDRLIGQRAATGNEPGDLFVFLGAKGGVGTTTLAVNTAAALAEEAPGQTLFIDLHLAYGDAGVYLGAESRFSVLDALENTHRLDQGFLDSLVTHTKSRLDLLASTDRAATGTVDSARIQTLLEQAIKQYRFVVVDVSRSDSAALEALILARTIVVVANQELATVRNASRIAARLRKRYGEDRVTLAISRADRSSEIGREDVEKAVGGKVRHSFPSDYRLALQAMNKGRPLTLDNHSSLAGSFKSFARDLAGLSADQSDDEAVNSGLFSRLAGRRR